MENMSVWKRLLAVLMVFALVIGYVPVGAAAEEATEEPAYTPAAMTTTVTEGMEFAIGEPTYFTYGTVANDDAGKMVKGRFEITNEDGSAVNMAEVAKLEYLEVQTDTWFEFYGDFGPAAGFPMMDATSSFRITFKQAGTYKVTVSMVEAFEDGTTGEAIIDPVVRTVVSKEIDSTVTTDLSDAVAGQVKNFTVTSDANSDYGTMVLGSFAVKQDGTDVAIADVAKLEYLEVQTNKWFEFYGDFGPADTGFPLVDATSNFRVTFLKTGTYTVQVFLKDLSGNVVTGPVETTVNVTYPEVTISGVEAGKWYNADQVVTLTVNAPGLTDAAQLPAASVTEGCGTVGGWVKAENGTWTNQVTVTATATVSCNGKEVEVKIDGVKPEAKITRSEQLSNDTTYVEFEVTAIGESGIASIKINGKSVTLEEGKLTGSCVLNGHADEVSIVVTSNAGLSSDGSPVVPQAALVIDISEPAIDENDGGIDGGTINGVTYVKSGTEIGVVVKNATNEYAPIVELKINGVPYPITAELDGTYTAKYPITGPVTKLVVYVKDAMGRECTKECPVNYAVGDANDPVVEIGKVVKGKRGNPSTITVTVSDKDGNLRPELYQGSIKLNYNILTESKRWDREKHDFVTVTEVDAKTVEIQKDKLNGWEFKNGTYTFVIAYYDYFGSVCVEIVSVEAMDNTSGSDSQQTTDDDKVVVDNTAPQIKAYFAEGNVTAFHQIDGEWFAVLDPTVYDSEDGPNEIGNATATLRVVVGDASVLTADNLVGDGWIQDDEEGKQWHKDFTVQIDDYQTAQMEIVFGANDGENTATETVNVEPVVENPDANILQTNFPIDFIDGQYKATLNFDRRAPGSSEVVSVVPTITVDDGYEESPEIYNEEFTFTMTVDDEVYMEETIVNEDGSEEKKIVAGGYNSGIKSVQWEITDGIGDTFFKASGAGAEAGTYTMKVEPMGNNETNSANLKIVVTDILGNTYTFHKEFRFDNLAPRASVAYDNNTAVNGNFFQSQRKATVTVEDLNAYNLSVTGTYDSVEENVYTFSSEGEHMMSVFVMDVAGNEAVVDYGENVAPNEFYIDLTNPSIQAEIATNANVQTDDETDFYNDDANISLNLTDMFMQDMVATIYYEDGTTENIPLIIETDGNTNETDMDSFVAVQEILEGKVVTDIVVTATDKSGRTSEWKNSADGSKKNIVVDKTAPEITVTKTQGNLVQTYQGEGWPTSVDYYNAETEYTINVTDKFLNVKPGVAQLVVNFAEDEEATVYDLFGYAQSEGELIGDVDTYEVSFTVADGKTLTDIKLVVLDNAGNTANLTAADAEEKTTFELKMPDGSDSSADPTWIYTGNFVVVDTVAPAATLTFSENVKTFFVRNNTVYLELVNPVNTPSGEESDTAEESVTVTIGVTDLNLAIDNENVHGVKAGKDTSVWVGETLVNGESTITYTAEKTKVGPDQTEMFVVDIEVSDLAGNVLKNFKSDVAADKTTYLPVKVSDTGAVKYNFSLDRMRPNSQNPDDSAPVIEVSTPNITPSATADGLELYNAAFNFQLSVNDGEDDGINSGLQYVKYTVTDKNGVVAEVNVNNPYDNGATEELVSEGEETEGETAETRGSEDSEKTADPVFSANYSIPVAVAAGFAGRQESNEVTLSIEAMDNVGNMITYSKSFGFDVQAPEITFEVIEKQDRPEGKYFNYDRKITVHVEDLNFNEATTTITDLGDASKKTAWTQNGNVWTATMTYDVDGDYGLEISSTDLAGHTTDKTSYDAANVKNIEDFTIDKTAPTIRVDFNPFIPVDTDDMGVQYFDKDRNVTVTIVEHNFDAADVKADLGAANALNGWATMGDTHTASEVFTEGNNYYVNVDFVDLAGNRAVGYTSPKFSVDLEAPAIEINKGSMSTGTLNIVPEDLILGFLVTDYQDNLKSLSVDVYHLDNSYQQTKVEGVEYYSITDGDRTTGYVDFTNIASEKENDGIYTVRVSALDYAGHTTYYPDVVFSLNRFGSTFVVSDEYTSDFLTADESGTIYQNEVLGNLIITEINPNRVWQDVDQTVEGSSITIAANGSSVTLVPGEDYEVTVTEKGTGNNKWYEYTYSINPDVFSRNDELVDGDYTIFFYSEDEAGNKNTNESNLGSALQLGADGTYSGKVSFTLDHNAPVVTVLNIEEGGQYVEANKNVEINVSDNSPISIAVYINDQLVEYVESAEGQPLTSDWLTYDPATGNYLLNMSEKDEVQNVRVVVTDAAGNVFEQTIGDITLTENLWVQFINNEALVIGSIVGLIALIILIILLLRKRKKKDETAAV